MNTELITSIANIALTLSFLVAFVFGVAQVKAASRDRRERLTLETLRNYQTREFAELMMTITTHETISTYEEFRELPLDVQIRFAQFSQMMESLGIMVAEKYVSLELVDKTLGSLARDVWKRYKPLYLDMREKLPDPFLSEYFQWLAERFDERMQQNPRKPFYE